MTRRHFAAITATPATAPGEVRPDASEWAGAAAHGRRRALAALGLLPWAWAAHGAGAPAPPEGPVVWPDLTLIDGQPWKLPMAADGRPHAIVAVLWSTTCPFCLRHNAHVEKLRRAARGRPLSVVTAAQDRDLAAVVQYLNRNDYGFAAVREYDRLRSLFTSRRVIPFTAVVDRHGQVVERLPGEMFEEDVLDLLKVSNT